MFFATIYDGLNRPIYLYDPAYAWRAIMGYQPYGAPNAEVGAGSYAYGMGNLIFGSFGAWLNGVVSGVTTLLGLGGPPPGYE